MFYTLAAIVAVLGLGAWFVSVPHESVNATVPALAGGEETQP
jgi:hypothetical protein